MSESEKRSGEDSSASQGGQEDRPDLTKMMRDVETDDGTTSHIDEKLRHTGAILGDFRLLRRLGKGGMAEVWLAEQQALKRNVALKLLRQDLTEDETYVARFQTEAKAAAGLNHPNIVQVYTVGAQQGQYFIAQEYVQGQTLKAYLKKKGPLEINQALGIMRQVASALQAASEQGIVHRDIKPENIMLTRKGEAKVADFGLAQLQGGERLNLTQEGVTMGTPLYMSPEQVSGKALDQRSDIYSFGVSCYHMLAGRPPFDGDNAVSVAVKHLHETAVPIEEIRPDLPKAICNVIRKMTRKDPEDRYSSAQEVLTDVRKIAKSLRTGESVDDLVGSEVGAGFPVRRPAVVLPLICAFVALASAGIGFAMRSSIPPRNPNAISTLVPKKSSAREQFIHAMFEVDNEDAFKAVLLWHGTDQVWTPRAHEQLALMYLKDPTRKEDAREQLAELKRLNSPESLAKARIGEAYLAASEGKTTTVRQTLSTFSNEFQRHLSGSWKQLENDVRNIVSENS